MAEIIKGLVSGLSQKNFDDNERSFVAYASKAVVDRDGEVVKSDAWELDRYQNNPVILLSHDHKSLPVAKALWVKMGPDGLQFKAQFAKTPAGREVYELYKDGILNAFSCGFIAKEWDDGKNYTDGKYKGASRVYTKAELLEISCVSVPSCPDALVQRTIKGDIKTAVLRTSLNELLAPVISDTNTKAALLKAFEETENEIRARVKDPELFDEDSFKRITLKKDSPKVFAIIGKLKGEDNTTIQSYRFPKADGWNMDDAKAWVKSHSKKEFTQDDITKGLEINKTVGLNGSPSIFDVIDGIRYGLSGAPAGYQYVYVEDIFPISATEGSCIIEIEPTVNGSDASYWHYDYKYDMATEVALLYNPVAVEEVYQRKHFITLVDKAGRELSARNIAVLQGCAGKMHEAADMIDGLLEGKVEPKAVKEDSVDIKESKQSLQSEAATSPISIPGGTVNGEHFVKALIDSINKRAVNSGDIADVINRAVNKRLGVLD